MKKTEGGVTAAEGFLAAGVSAGIKKNKKDMALIYSRVSCAAAGTFTTNRVKAAPVLWDRRIVNEKGIARAVVINSGIANACTGERGMRYCVDTAKAVSELLHIDPDSVLVASTGVIGTQLPMDKIREGIGSLSEIISAGSGDHSDAAAAIMTTDTRPKETAYTFEIGGKTVTIGGMCKGSGMIHPNMCTMLSFLTTDVNISGELLKEALSRDICDTYNMVSVDGDTSTNDTVLLLANGLAGNEKITEKNDDYEQFVKALHAVNTDLSKMIASDGEGATALFEVTVRHASGKEQAVMIAKSVVSSTLVKAAVCGHDANWGRILCAAGYSGADFDPEAVDLYFESANGALKIVENGAAADYPEEKATEILSAPEVTAVIDLKQGEFEATAWGCDLTHEYVSINADYRS